MHSRVVLISAFAIFPKLGGLEAPAPCPLPLCSPVEDLQDS